MNKRNVAMLKLGQLYKNSDLTLDRISRELGMCVASISNYVHHRHPPGRDVANRVIEYVDSKYPGNRTNREVT